MPQLNVLFWNIQNFGDDTGYRARQSRIQFIAHTVLASQADIVCIQEVKQNAIANLHLSTLQEALNALPAPFNNWYFDWVKGSVTTVGGAVPPPLYPFNTFADTAWDAGHQEGYAVFWNQNIAKFTMQAAPPIQPWGAGAAVPNQQSGQCRMQGVVGFGAPPAFLPLPGVAVPAGGLQVPAVGMPYVLPAGTTPPGGAPLGAATPTAAGTVLPVGTVVGAGGITLNAVTAGVNPVVVPGGFTLTDALTLPAAGTVVVPENAAGLVLFGRDSSLPGDPNHAPSVFNGDTSAITANFAPGAANNWAWIDFTRSAAGAASRTGARRPAYVTIRVNRPGFPAAADQLVPIIVYHAPSAAPASSAGMQRSAYSQPMYQAYDWTAGGWIDCNNALIGGDYNVVMGGVLYAYNAFLNPWGMAGGMGGGAGATMAVANPAPPGGGGMAANPLNKSMVALTAGVGGPPVYSANLPDFRSLAIDNVFYRGLGGGVVAGNTLLLDLLVASYAGGGALTGAPVQNCLNCPNMVNTTNAWIAHAPIVLPSMVDPITSLLDMQAGAFGTQPNYTAQNTGARRAAEFVNLFVSDHLPVAIGFNM